MYPLRNPVQLVAWIGLDWFLQEPRAQVARIPTPPRKAVVKMALSFSANGTPGTRVEVTKYLLFALGGSQQVTYTGGFTERSTSQGTFRSLAQ